MINLISTVNTLNLSNFVSSNRLVTNNRNYTYLNYTLSNALRILILDWNSFFLYFEIGRK